MGLSGTDLLSPFNASLVKLPGTQHKESLFMARLPASLQWRLPLFAAALWWGGLCVAGFIAVPLMFMHLPLAALAGQVAAKLFSAMTWVAVACGFVIIFSIKPPRVEDDPHGAASAQARSAIATTGWALAGVILALLLEFAVAPRIVARENLALWHNLGSAMYLLQWVCATVVMWRLAGAYGLLTLRD